jgi:hypothetical protein
MSGMRRNAPKGERLIEFDGRVVVFINEPYGITQRACETKNRDSQGFTERRAALTGGRI